MKKQFVLVVLFSALIAGLTGCDRQTIGAAGGAAIGGTVGGLAGGTTGAVIGGVGGAALGSYVAKKTN